jgi:CheY-like chemotaxis protein
MTTEFGADTLAMVFEVRGFVATAVYSGEQAVDLAKPVHFDAVVSDVMMPGISDIAMAIEITKMSDASNVVSTSWRVWLGASTSYKEQ